MNQSIETLIIDHSEVMAEQMQKAAKWAGSEEDVRHEVNKLIDEFISKAGLNIKGKHEYSIAGGRIDSKYGGVVIEYKHPKGSGKITVNGNAPGFKAVVKQIKQRFNDFESEENVSPERIFGVGCDGNTIVYVRKHGKRIEAEDPQEVTPFTVERLLRALVSLGAQGYSFTPDNLNSYFGSDSESAQEGIKLLHDLIRDTKSTKAKTFFSQWQILFGEVCGFDIHAKSSKIIELAKKYGLSNPKPTELLFAIHTYYAIFMKLLAAEIVSSFSPLGTSTLKKLVSAPSSERLREELRKLELGGIWSQLGIKNFLEGDLFSWYLDAWNDDCAKVIRVMIQSLDKFDPNTLSVEPAESRDLLKHLYHQLFPRQVRHDLGEYYTPDWLAELVLDEVEYDGNPDKRVLDPACGSGTFLVMALNRVKKWYDEHRYDCGYGEDVLLKKILQNIIGFDLNPLAVMASRTNYLLAIRDLLRHGGEIEIPVYLCDSVMTPSEYGDFFTGELGKARLLKTSVGEFRIPTEVTNSRKYIGLYADLLESCIRDEYSPEEFVTRCKSNSVPMQNVDLHVDLYKQIKELDKNNQNGIWARIIKNAFAPLFIDKVDFVIGNPPWVNWENLPEGYRNSMKPLWESYGLFTLTGQDARLGGGKKDLSILFTYASVDSYLKTGGHLGFVITQTIFKSQGAGDGFRRFKYNIDEQYIYINPIHVHDFSRIQVFEGATNRTSIFLCVKESSSFRYPVPYKDWSGPSRLDQSLSLNEVYELTERSDLNAVPVNSKLLTSPWLTAPENSVKAIRTIIGNSTYNAYEGTNTGGLNSCYWIDVLKELPNGEILIQNMNNIGRIKLKHVEAILEADLIFPLLRGRDVIRWKAKPSLHILLAQDPNTQIGYPEVEMKERWPKTYSYLRLFEGNASNPVRGTLRGRALYKRYYSQSAPFYSMYNVGPYTMSKHKVVWREQSSFFQAAYVGPNEDKPIVPDHKLMLVSCSNEVEAHFLVGMLNSSPSMLAICSYVLSTSTSTHVLNNIAVPEFEKTDPDHIRLAEVSRGCHEAAAKDDESKVHKLEKQIDLIAGKIWGISKVDLEVIQEALAER